MASSAPSEERKSSPILEEIDRLRVVDSVVAEQWHEEVSRYEDGVRNGPGPGADATATPGGSFVEHDGLFPYHPALSPLLDCYDSISAGGGDGVVRDIDARHRASPAPSPLEYNGHRRSRFSPRPDRHGLHIEEAEAVDGHLPNSAWAIRQTLMPRGRKAQFGAFEMSKKTSSDGGGSGRSDEAEPDDDDDGGGGDDDNDDDDVDDVDIQDGGTRHDGTRFWDVLMNPTSGEVELEEMSLPPDADDDADADGGAGELSGNDDGSEWEDVDEEDEAHATHSIAHPGSSGSAAAKNARDFTFLTWWQHSIVNERRGVVDVDVEVKPAEEAPSLAMPFNHHSPEMIGEGIGSTSATHTLLRVLKHSLSELQRDFRLARAVLLLIADWKLCDIGDGHEKHGIDCLRYVLTIVSSEYISCGGYCHEYWVQNGGVAVDDDEYENALENAPSHYCADWWKFLGSLSTLLSYGIINMTKEYANVICAFVADEINRVSGSAAPTDHDIEGSGEARSGKAYLKQNLYFLNNADQAEGGARQVREGCQQIKTNIVMSILCALRHHAASDRMRLNNLLESSANNKGDGNGNECTSIQTKTALESFNQCVNMMVDIGERCLLRLPANNYTRSLCGMLVRGLVESYVGSESISPLADKPMSYMAEGTSLRSVIDPLRYADAVSNASNNPLLDPSRISVQRMTDEHSIETLIGFQPPRDVQDIVKALFKRDIVDTEASGCGYGDFLVWCHLPIYPDSFLVDYISNFPTNDTFWVKDEEGTALDYGQLSARYDFQLLMFIRQWAAPWSPESHLSFSIPYRRAVSTLALCAHRYSMPADICSLVNSFLPRSWWPDERRCCWYRDCQLDHLKREFQDKIMARQNNWERSSLTHKSEGVGKAPDTFLTCSGCNIALACSKEHMKFIHQDGHKKWCGLPPFRLPFSEEDNCLCREVFGETHNAENEDLEEENYEEGDEEGSWESVDSSEVEDAAKSKTDLIYSFFNNKSYKLQRRDGPAFAAFF